MAAGEEMCSLVLRGVQEWRRGVKFAYLVSTACARASCLLSQALAESVTGLCMGLLVPFLSKMICANPSTRQQWATSDLVTASKTVTALVYTAIHTVVV